MGNLGVWDGKEKVVIFTPGKVNGGMATEGVWIDPLDLLK